MPQRFESLVDMQERSCDTNADRPFLGTRVSGVYRWTTYAEFAQHVDRLRSGLAQLGVARGDKVAVVSGNRVEWAVAAFASYGLGAHFVPLHASQAAAHWSFILRDSQAKVLLCAGGVRSDVRELASSLTHLEHVLCFDDPPDAPGSYAAVLENGAADPIPSLRPKPHETAALIYTSGTMGDPKGVVLSHGNFVSNVNAIHQIYSVSNTDVSCSFLPWAHVFGQTCELYGLMSLGGAIALSVGPHTLMNDLAEVRPTVLFAVPRVFDRVYDELNRRLGEQPEWQRRLFAKGRELARQRRAARERGDRAPWLAARHAALDRAVFAKIRARFGGRLRWVISGGSALARDVAEFIDDLGITVFEGYGLTETSPIVTANYPDAARLGTAGRPIPGVDVFICDADDRVLDAEQEGEVVVVGPNVMQGYYRRPDLTDEVIFELDGLRALRTGDIGHRTDDGFLVLTGRINEQYTLQSGAVVTPTPLETQLRLSPFVSQAFLYGDGRAYSVCLVVPDFDTLREWARARGVRELDRESLAAHGDVHAMIGDELRATADAFEAFARPRQWAVLADDFTVENGLLSPKLSTKRQAVLEAYRERIKSLYHGDGEQGG